MGDVHKFDYYTVHWNNKIMHLDDIESKHQLNEDRVIVAVKFIVLPGDTILRLQVKSTRIDYATGELSDLMDHIMKHKQLITFPADERPNGGKKTRTELKLENAGDPTQVQGHLPNSESGQYVQFQITDLEKDLGQHTVPFLDIQAIETNPPSPISGISLYHQGAPNSGGFLELKIMHFDYTSHM